VNVFHQFERFQGNCVSSSEVQRYYRQTRRGSADFVYERLEGRLCWSCRGVDSILKKNLLSDPDQFFEGVSLLKNGNTCTVVELESDGKFYVLKRYNQKSFIYRLLHGFSTPRAVLNWSNGQVLRYFGVRTPRPLICVCEKSVGLLKKAYVLMEKVEGKPLSQVADRVFEAVDPPVPRQFADLWQELTALRTTHGDMKAANFMLNEKGQLVLIDLDSMRFHRSFRRMKHKQEKDLKRFLKNWEAKPSLREQFIKALSNEFDRLTIK